VTVEQVCSLAAYNRWANSRLLQAAAVLHVEALERDLGASFGSLQGTLIHILWGERGWLHFWQHGSFVPKPTPSEYPDIASLRWAWTQHDDAYASYLCGRTQAELDAPRALDADIYTLGELVQHVINHSTYHRGQIALLLRQLGHEPPSTDYHDFLADARVGGA
jgi:uncharacterized damage-inducible protein DinB